MTPEQLHQPVPRVLTVLEWALIWSALKHQRETIATAGAAAIHKAFADVQPKFDAAGLPPLFSNYADYLDALDQLSAKVNAVVR